MLRPFRITCEIVASLVGIAVALILFAIWRLSTGPMHAEFLTPTIEVGIESIAPGTHVAIAHTLLTWDAAAHSVALHADDLHVSDNNGDAIASVPEMDIELNALGVLFGQFLPTALRVEHPEFKLERQPDGAFMFGGVTTGAPASADNKSRDTLKDSLARIARNLEHAFFTRRLEITHAIFAIHDRATDSDWSVSIPEVALERSGLDLSGKAIFDVAQKDHFSTIEAHYAFDRSIGQHRITTRFADITPAFFAGGHPATLGLGPLSIVNLPLTGEIALSFDGDLNVAAGALDLHGSAGSFNAPTLWDGPRAVASLDLKAYYNRDSGMLNIPSASIDFGGPRLSLSATGTPGPKDMDFTLSAQLDNLPMDQYGQLWPKPAVPGAREWIAANISKGMFTHAEAQFKGTVPMEHPDDVHITEGGGKASATNGTLHYADGMPPVEGVNADATFDLSQLTAQISGGGVGDIKVLPFALTITGFEDNVQNIAIPLKVAGPIPSILKLIDNPPLGYAKAVGLKPEELTGQAEAEMTFRFPLLRELGTKDIAVAGTAKLSNVASSKLLKGVDITQGNLTLALTAEDFTVTGPTTLNGIAAQVAWEQRFHESADKPLREATVSGRLSAQSLQKLGVDAFDGTKGTMAATLHMVQPTKTRTLFDGAFDMTGAEVHVDQLNWKKPAPAAAGANFAAEQEDGKDIRITTIDVHGPAINVKGKASLTDDGKLTSLNLDPMIVGRSNAAVHFSRLNDDKGGALHFDAEGEALDISGFLGGKEPENSQPQPKEFRIRVGKLYTSDTGLIAHAEGFAIRDAKGWSEISLHGLADSSHALDVNLSLRKDGGRDLSILCDDFGTALKGLGFADKVRGGKLEITGASDPNDPRAIVGKLSIGSFTAGDLPVLAVLMNAASPFGFSGLFSGSMDFDHVRGNFRWEGDTINLIGVHAAGAAVGLNIDGRVDMDSGDANLRGTMVPFSVVNNVIGYIPVLGDLFTGGKNQGFFAVNYSITGPVDNPSISVNPASLLTPGFLRNIFFGGGDGDDQKAVKP